jgi:hypothetical protein
MNRGIARALTALYSTRWRNRYGEEFEGLLQDLPLTPSLIADVVPRAMLSRRSLLAALAGLLMCFTAIALQHHTSSGEPASIVSRDSAPGACRSYSSATHSGWIAQQRCWD